MATVAEPQPVVIEESTSTKILRLLGRAPVHRSSSRSGLLWLVPTAGLFITVVADAFRPAERLVELPLKPSAWTVENYRNRSRTRGSCDALIVTAQGRSEPRSSRSFGASLAGMLSAWIDFPAATGRSSRSSPCWCANPMALIPMFSLYNRFSLFDNIPGDLFHRRLPSRSRSSC